MFPFTVESPCERVLFDHSPFYGGSLLRAVAGCAATATLSRFVSTGFDYFDAIPPMFRFTIRDVLWLTVVAGLGDLRYRFIKSKTPAAIASTASKSAL